MKNLITFLALTFALTLSASAQSGFKLVDIVTLADKGEHIPVSPQFKADENGGSCTFKVKYNAAGTCKQTFKMDWSFSTNIGWIGENQIFTVEMKATQGEEPCGYRWVDGSVLGTNNIFGAPGYDWEYNGNMYTTGLGHRNGGRLKFWPGGVRSAAQDVKARNFKTTSYTAFCVSIDGHKVFYIYKYYAQKPTDAASCESGKCDWLYAVSYNAGATHIRLGADHRKSLVLSNLDNTITAAQNSGCFDTKYLRGLRDRISSESRSVSSYLKEFERFMHNIPQQVKQDCPCCLPCESASAGSCAAPSTSDFKVTLRTKSKLYVHSHTDAKAWRWTYAYNGKEQVITDHDPILSLGDLPSNTEVTFRLEIQCENGAWSNSSGIFRTSTSGSSTACAKPDINNFLVTKHTSNTIILDANVEAVEYHWTWFINGKTYVRTDDDPRYGFQGIPANSEVVVYLKVKCANGKWSDESARFVIYTKRESNSRSRSQNPSEEAPTAVEISTKMDNISQHAPEDLDSDIQLTVFPNPASDLLTIKGDFEEADIHIMNLTGQEISKFEGVLKSEQLDISDLRSGMYAILIKTETGQVARRVVVSR